MLRIGAKNNLFLSKRGIIFSPDLLKGVALAFLLHLLLFFGLRITSPPNPDILSPIAPLTVEVDLGKPRITSPPPAHVAVSPIEQIAPPQLLEMPKTRLVVESLLSQNELKKEPDFSEIERIEYELLEDDD